MQRTIIFLMCLVLVLPALSKSDKLYLKDGSVIKGKMVKMTSDSIRFRTSFGATIDLTRDEIIKIDLADSLESAKEGNGGSVVSSQPGHLKITFDSGKYSSSIKVHRGHDLQTCLRANSIEQAVFIDNNKVFSQVDSSTDKEINKGPDKIYKNSIVLKDVDVELSAGPHSCRIVVRNLGWHDFKDRFEGKPLDEEFKLGDIIIYPGKTKLIYAKVKKKKWGLGGKQFEVKY